MDSTSWIQPAWELHVVDGPDRRPEPKTYTFADASFPIAADTKIEIFGAELHVHSCILGCHSAWFRQYLDSPDKTPALPSAYFKHEYVAVVDDDEAWEVKCTSGPYL